MAPIGPVRLTGKVRKILNKNFHSGQSSKSRLNFLCFQVSIIGVVGSSYTGDIALDDIKVVPSRCSVVPAKAKPVIKTTQRPSMKRPTTRQTTRPSTRKPTTVKPTTIKPTSVPSLLKGKNDLH